MLKEPTTEKLKAMRLDAMAAAWNEQQGKPDIAGLSFDERFGMLVDAEWLHRETKRLTTALRDAKLKLVERVPRRHRVLAEARDRSRTASPARRVPLGRRAPQRPHHRDDRDWQKRTSRARSRSKRAAKATVRSTDEHRGYSPSSRSRAPTEPIHACSPRSRAPTCSCSTTGRSRRSPKASAAICSRCSRIGTARDRPS